LDFLVLPSDLKGGTVTVPGDKSISHRALILGAVAEGQSKFEGFLAGEDCLTTLASLNALGVFIGRDDDGTSIIVEGVGLNGLKKPDKALDLGNSGTGMRLLAGLLCAQDFDSNLMGDASLSTRPMDRIIEPLSQMGAGIDSNDGNPPLFIHGGRELNGIHYTLPVASAQVKSAILLAGLCARGETVIIERSVTRDHTERMLRSMGASVSGDSGQVRLQPTERLNATSMKIPADLSSASFLMLAALIAKDADVLITNVGVNPTRTGVIEILREMGGDVGVENPQLVGEEPVADIRVKSSVLHGIAVDPSMVSRAIDEFPLLFVAAANAVGSTRFSGIAELRVKESDRISAMATGLRLMGIRIDESEDAAEIHYGEPSGAIIDSFGDHRVAMSFAVAATIADSAVRVCNIDAVDTSFPGFSDVMESLGVSISKEQARQT
jgi:3-phosphoshikimate 1-carboxyvinyltransferase